MSIGIVSFARHPAAGCAACLTALTLAACSGGGSSTVASTVPTAAPKRCVQTAFAPGTTRSVVVGVMRVRPPSLDANPGTDIVLGEVGVRFASADPRLLQRAASLAGGHALTTIDEHGAATLAISANADPRLVAQAIRAMPGVIDAGPIAWRRALDVIPDDPDFGSLPYDPQDPSISNPPIEWDMYVMSLPKAWARSQAFGVSSVRVAIIDTGYDTHNVDLQGGRVVASVVYDRGDGTVDSGATIQDGDGHGTDTTGIAASDTNNAVATAGMAGGISLMEARVFPTPSPQHTNPPASSRDVAAAIDWAVQNGAKVINLSLGSGTADTTYEEPAVARAIAAGVTVVAAAGNGNARGVGQPMLDFPAADPGVIAVGASALCDGSSARDFGTAYEYVASYSNYTRDKSRHFVVAPGGDPSSQQIQCPVSSCIDYLQWILNLYSTTAFGGGSETVLIAGTSMASPHVAGLAALMLSENASLTPSQIATIVTSTAIDISDSHQGYGRVDADAALASVP
jgi:subtilisin family serine protease